MVQRLSQWATGFEVLHGMAGAASPWHKALDD
jgi:hypothetical protein